MSGDISDKPMNVVYYGESPPDAQAIELALKNASASFPPEDVRSVRYWEIFDDEKSPGGLFVNPVWADGDLKRESDQ